MVSVHKSISYVQLLSCVSGNAPLSDNLWMLYFITAASLCQHLTFHKETAHTKFPWFVLSQPLAAARGEVLEQDMSF